MVGLVLNSPSRRLAKGITTPPRLFMAPSIIATDRRMRYPTDAISPTHMHIISAKMNLEGKTVWHHAAGDTNRNYVNLCLEWGVIVCGPGYAGPMPSAADRLRADNWNARKITDLKRFSTAMNLGDIVLLRLGTNEVHGVGEIVGEYEWHEEFGDIDGWDLQHLRRVQWIWKPLAGPMRFEAYSMYRGGTTLRLSNGPVMEWLCSLVPDTPLDSQAQIRSLPDLAQRDLAMTQISSYLLERGVTSSSVSRLESVMEELRHIAIWYTRTQKPSEHETVAYLVVPLLRALGWTPERMAIEWNRVDIALFDELPRKDAHLCAVVEAKKMDDSCLTAVSQALGYARTRPHCQRLVVTDGLRYGVYTRTGDGEFRLYAYLNLTQPRTDYPVYGCLGAREALYALSPEWQTE